MSCPGCEIPGRSGFTFHGSHNSKALRGCWSQSGSVQVAGSLRGGSEDTPPLHIQESPSLAAFSTDSIDCSADLVESVFRVWVMDATQSADGDLVLP